MRKELEGLVAAPSMIRPSPAVLTGRAAAVFSMKSSATAPKVTAKDVTEGQTFSKKVGEQILPTS